MAVKRRTIWMSDEDWQELTKRAVERDLSPSAYIQAVTVGNGFIIPRAALAAEPDVAALDPYRGVLNAVALRQFNSRPFSPAPKKGK